MQLRDGHCDMATYNTINNDVTMSGDEGTLLANRYRIVRQLGQGGMGSVWLAEDTQLDNKPFAIKMLPSILVSNKRAYRQLKDEALVAMKLVHPNIVQLRAFEENGGNPFLVMDYIDGETLDDHLAEKGKLSEDETIRLLKPIAAALDYAHGEGVVHRDVKPANVMIRNDGHPYILDFGIAREIQETMTRVTGKLSSGTLLYMSPEQLNGDSPKPAQDVYSFAAMAYECLKGEPPFVRGSIEDQIKNRMPKPLNCSGFGLGIMRGLAKRPEDRPVTCAAVFQGIASVGVERGGVGGLAKPLAILAFLLALVCGGYYGWERHLQKLSRLAREKEEAEIAAREKEEAARVAKEKAEREAAERKAQEEAMLKAEKEESERLAREKEEAARAAKEKAEREAAERKAREEAMLKDEKEESERLAREKEEAARAAKEKAEREAAERKAQEKARRKAEAEKTEAERMAREKEEADRAEEKIRKEAEYARIEKQSHLIAELTKKGFILDAEANARPAGTLGVLRLPNGEKMEMAWCPPGWFIMGSPATESERIENESCHPVRITKGFWIGRHEVTRSQWASIMGGSSWWGGRKPKDSVSWNDSKLFIAALNRKVGCRARLPSEAEWEYACRAGTRTPFSFGFVLNGAQACCNGGEPYGTSSIGAANLTGPNDVGCYSPNGWGIYDMHGNLFEWCEDFFGNYPAANEIANDPLNDTPGFSAVRVVRGGCWNYAARQCRSAFRRSEDPGRETDMIGFRICMDNLP